MGHRKKIFGNMQHEMKSPRLYYQTIVKKDTITYKANKHEKDFLISRSGSPDGYQRLRQW
jgi:hypothetical protein